MIKKLIRKLLLKRRNYTKWFIETQMLPNIKNKKVLVVGVADYCKNYLDILEKAGCDITTIDINPLEEGNGAEKHIIGDIRNPPQDYGFDCIIMLGVVNFGLDTICDVDKALQSCYCLLYHGGTLILDWNKSFPNHNKINPRDVENFYLFQAIDMFGIGSGNEMPDDNVFEFLMKV